MKIDFSFESMFFINILRESYALVLGGAALIVNHSDAVVARPSPVPVMPPGYNVLSHLGYKVRDVSLRISLKDKFGLLMMNQHR